MECPSIVSQKVCVEAKVTVEPEAKIGDVHACCVGKPQFEECRKKSHGCTYMVSQMLCVRFPLTISAAASAKPAGIVCGKPTVKPSCHEDDPCMEEMPREKEAMCKTMDKDAPCFRPMILFDQKPEEKPCAQVAPCKRVRHHDTNNRYHEKPNRRRCPLCFLPFSCLPFYRPRNKCYAAEKSRYRWPVC